MEFASGTIVLGYQMLIVGQYPVIIYGTFGITNSKHGIIICPSHKSYGRYLLSDLVQKHQLQKKYADHLYEATTNGLDPRRTNLLSGNEAIIDSDHSTPCPFTSGMVHLIQCGPTQSQNIPCSRKQMEEKDLNLHLKQHHRLTPTTVKKSPRTVVPDAEFHKIFGIPQNRPFPCRIVRPG
ncbi:unnamed protein product [Adineta steineri]|uniref:Uncharacterized protein n=1 Tax=Adineta steineri TaxID=433720 RepID=A0A820AH40_9BILA|nr:unnamed protein product [Adineta steineri]CAF4185412.1 unnamed protein product [Adineta steineri]